MPVMLAFFLVCAVVTQAAALDDSQSTASNMVKGDVMYWEGEELIVKEMSGKEVRLRVTAETKIEGAASRLKTGDKITAQVNSDGRTLSIALQISEGGSASGLPGTH
ncbi:MAG: hypothetical protein HY038_12945 [Nitrospirae bacterium]|nr:hypothetical protein [Nitrospirota bacterium]